MRHWLGDLDAPLNCKIGQVITPPNYNKSVDVLIKKEKKTDAVRKVVAILRWLRRNG